MLTNESRPTKFVPGDETCIQIREHNDASQLPDFVSGWGRLKETQKLGYAGRSHLHAIQAGKRLCRILLCTYITLQAHKLSEESYARVTAAPVQTLEARKCNLCSLGTHHHHRCKEAEDWPQAHDHADQGDGKGKGPNRDDPGNLVGHILHSTDILLPAEEIWNRQWFEPFSIIRYGCL